ncbi:MAG: thioredoxin family protein [Bacteroidales bacterium]|nr:thioredoxin family protein [Bacteroidales bacterium]
MKRFFTLAMTLLLCAAGFAQEATIKWKTEVQHIEDATYSIVFTGKIGSGYHTYGVDNPDSPTSVEFDEPQGYSLSGSLYELSKPSDYEGMKVFFKEIKIAQDIVLLQDEAIIKGEISWLSCTETSCISPEFFNFSISTANAGSSESASVKTQEINAGNTSITAEEESRGFNWALIIEAILWGFAALLTPCVFPMVPMTVSFFMKGSSSPAAGRFKASMYGLFIVLLYTVPISLIILITRVVGGDAVTADIFNWLATHWLPNIIFFIVFMIFAASFFGAFEIVLPSKLVNKSDRGADKGGLLGIFFMSLTLVLVSFSCTGPIVGSVLIKATQGQFWEPMIAMLAFSVAFALPFTILAFFPSLLKNLPKSGGWLNSVKVVLGFIEVALGFKFLSVADQTYHWGLLDREVYLAIWITVFSLLGLYLLGKIRFAHDDKTEHVSVKRLALSIAVFSFVVYMIPGMFGAPLKALSGYLPPISTQDFVIGAGSSAQASSTKESKYDLHLPHGLQGYFNLKEGLEAAKAEGKPVFVDITGHGCVNCREMEARVWSDPKVLDILSNKYVIVALYTDDKQKLDKEDWITTESGDVLKTLGRANSYIARTRFGVNAQPNYVLLSPDGKQLAPVRGYNLNVQEFVDFLNIPFTE